MIAALVLFVVYFCYAIQSPLSQEVIIIDQKGCGTPECCVYGKHPCSNFSTALNLVMANTEIRVMSDISFHLYINRSFENITITGYNNPIVKCDRLGGIYSYHFIDVTIQNITWDRCRGFGFCFANVDINGCTFQLFEDYVIQIVIEDSTCDYISSNLATKPVININKSLFYNNSGGICIASFSIDYIIIVNDSECCLHR